MILVRKGNCAPVAHPFKGQGGSAPVMHLRSSVPASIVLAKNVMLAQSTFELNIEEAYLHNQLTRTRRHFLSLIAYNHGLIRELNSAGIEQRSNASSDMCASVVTESILQREKFKAH